MSFRYPPPSGYKLPVQPYSKFGYDGQLWLPAQAGKVCSVMPAAAVAAFNGDFGALAVSLGLTPRSYFRGDIGVTSSTGTITGWANQAGDSTNMVIEATAASLGTVTTGLGGKAGVASNGTTQGGTHTITSVAPATVNECAYEVFRVLATPTASGVLFGGTGLQICAYVNGGQTSPAANIQQYNGGGGVLTTGVVINQWYRGFYSYTGSSADTFRIGAHSPTPGITTNNVPSASRGCFCTASGASRVSAEKLMSMVLDGPQANQIAFRVAADALLASVWGAGIEI